MQFVRVLEIVLDMMNWKNKKMWNKNQKKAVLSLTEVLILHMTDPLDELRSFVLGFIRYSVINSGLHSVHKSNV